MPPMEGAVPVAPEQVEIWFSEEVDPDQLDVQVIGPTGERVADGPAKVDLYDPERRRVIVPLVGDLEPGVYLVQWHAASAIDRDAVDGSFRFTIDPSAPTVAPLPTEEVTPIDVDLTPQVPVANDPAPGLAAWQIVVPGLVVVVVAWQYWRLRRVKPDASSSGPAGAPSDPSSEPRQQEKR